MFKFIARGPARPTCVIALAVASAAACNSVLDIDEPKLRPDTSEGGDTSGISGGTSNASAGVSPLGGSDEGEGEGGTPSAAGNAGDSGNAGNGGEGGDAILQGCRVNSVRCTEKTPEICGGSGNWIPNAAAANGGDCAVACDDGKCVECLSTDAPRCSVCEAGAQNCSPNQPQTCVDGAWQNDGPECAHYCNAGTCRSPASCPSIAKEQTSCTDRKESCCRSLLVPGGSFFRDFDASSGDGETPWTAEVSAFYLDKFEVTVGRMRSFVNAYPQLMLDAGAGKADHVVSDPGWDEDYVLPVDAAGVVSALKCAGAGAAPATNPLSTWSDDATLNNTLPVNCVPFNLAYAFCIWDGGRLPTEAEWNLAAAGGAEHRPFPWKTPDSGLVISPLYAHYDQVSVGPISVGKTPAGDGRWGQSDLAGNVAEWVLDFRGDYPPHCKDCLNTTAAPERSMRGGSYAVPDGALSIASYSSLDPMQLRPFAGFRCARDLR